MAQILLKTAATCYSINVSLTAATAATAVGAPPTLPCEVSASVTIVYYDYSANKNVTKSGTTSYANQSVSVGNTMPTGYGNKVVSGTSYHTATSPNGQTQYNSISAPAS